MKNEEVMLSVMKLYRAMRRVPPERRRLPFPPGVASMLLCVAGNPGISSRDLCEMMDLRPSSLSEMLARAEKEGWILRAADEKDRRIQHVSLSGRGQDMVDVMNADRRADAEMKTACFTEAEKEQFVTLCDRLSTHLEALASDAPHERLKPSRAPGALPPPGFPEGPDFPPFPEEKPDAGEAGAPEEAGAEANSARPRRPFPAGGRYRS